MLNYSKSLSQNRSRVLSCLVAAFFCVANLSAQPRVIFTGGSVVDGTGLAPYAADVAIRDGVIVEVGNVTPGPQDTVISATGLLIAPGFIDLHNHSTQGLLEEPEAATQVSQGITTVALGPDGGSPFPPGHYFEQIQVRGTAVNVALMVGHGKLRSMIMGRDYKRTADDWEIEAMAALVKVAMQQGAFGLSSGLEYDPGFYSSTSELVSLARVAREYGGIYMTHIRDEEEGFLEALNEAIEIGRQAGLPVQISHLKLGNRRVWNRTGEVLDLLRRANEQGVDVTADCYPYNAWASDLSILVPSRRFDDRAEIEDGFDKVGGPGKVLITRYPPDPTFEFKTVEQLSQSKQVSPVDLFKEMIQQGGASVVCESMSQEDVDAFYRDPLVLVGSDGGLDLRHPRKAGTFTRVLGNFVRERKLLSIETAIEKMTRLPASRLGLADRGKVAPGFRADLVVFDPKTIIDRATFQEPDLLSEGIRWTLVNGEVVWEDGKTTGKLPGAILRRSSKPLPKE